MISLSDIKTYTHGVVYHNNLAQEEFRLVHGTEAENFHVILWI